MFFILLFGDVLINGFFHEHEWANAKKAEINGIHVWVMSDDLFFYLAIFEKDVVHTGIDLYLHQINQPTKRFHVSSALALATWQDGTWQESWECNYLWAANKIGVYTVDGKRMMSQPEAFEFQIDRRLLSGEELFLAVHLKRPDKKVPAQGRDAPTPLWMRIERF